jgi:hypothetical protein
MKILLFIINFLILSYNAFGADISPTYDTYIDCFDGQLKIVKGDYLNGNGEFVDSLPLPNARYYRGIDWSLYEPINDRIFYQETNIPTPPIYIHVYELNTKKSFDLPYKNYFGGHAEMLISPQSRYIIMSCLSDSDTSPLRDYSETAIKEQRSKLITYVLDGNSLDSLGARKGMDIHAESPLSSFISSDNTNLINIEYLPVDNQQKNDFAVIYTLPDLNPVDSFNIETMGWSGIKWAPDLSIDYLLINGNKTDSSGGLAPGSYIFVVNYKTKEITSPIIPFVGRSLVLSPDATEIICFSQPDSTIIRYSATSGEVLGKITIPYSVNLYSLNFRTDGKLYIKPATGDYPDVAIDYKNNTIDRTFRIEQR